MGEATMRARSGNGKKLPTRSVSEAAAIDPITRDMLLRAVGSAREMMPLKAARVAAVLGTSPGHESKVRSGQRSSPMSRAAIALYEAVRAEACPLEQAGVASAYVEVTLRAVAMWPELEKLSDDELLLELKREIVRVETRANSACNEAEAEYLMGGKLGGEGIRALMEGHTKQGAASIRITAICQVLMQREEQRRPNGRR